MPVQLRRYRDMSPSSGGPGSNPNGQQRTRRLSRVVKCLTNDSWSHSHSISPPYLDVVTNSHFYAVITDNLCALLIFWQFHGLLACHRRHLMPHVCGVYNFSVTQNRMQLSSNLFVQLNCMCLTHI